VNRRSGLGRGLGSLIPAESTSDIEVLGLLEIPISAIAPNREQPRSRFDEEALVTLTDSIRELGVLQPILVRPMGEGRYELIAGERRWRAARRAGLPTIPSVVREVDTQASLEQAVVENLHRQDLNAMEEAAAYQRLVEEFEMTQDQVARRVGKSRSAVANTLRLFQLPASVQRMIADGDLSPGHARALLSHPDRGLQERLAGVIAKGGLSVRQTEDLVRKSSELDLTATEGREASGGDRRPRTIGQTRPAALLELEELLGGHLETRVHVSVGKAKGRVVIEFADIEDLKRIYQLMMHSTE
jgi:ParB family transcriptional regulator, chromosome partitioning protein